MLPAMKTSRALRPRPLLRSGVWHLWRTSGLRTHPGPQRCAKDKKRRPFRTAFSRHGRRRVGAGRAASGRLQIVSSLLATLGDDVVADGLAFSQRAQPGALNGADVDENVLAAVLGAMNPKPLVVLNHLTVPVAIVWPP